MSYRQEKGLRPSGHAERKQPDRLCAGQPESLYRQYCFSGGAADRIDQSSINQALAKEYSDHITDNERRLEQVLEFKARLYESLVGGMLTKEEYASYKAKYTKQAEDIRESIRVLKEKLTEVLENRSERNRWISQFTQFSTLETLDRRALIHMVQSIRVRGKKELDITFTHEDEYKKALQLLALAAQQKDYEQRKVG